MHGGPNHDRHNVVGEQGEGTGDECHSYTKAEEKARDKEIKTEL